MTGQREAIFRHREEAAGLLAQAASHLFEGPGALESAVRLAGEPESQ